MSLFLRHFLLSHKSPSYFILFLDEMAGFSLYKWFNFLRGGNPYFLSKFFLLIYFPREGVETLPRPDQWTFAFFWVV
jgi:hypothetical protein